MAVAQKSKLLVLILILAIVFNPFNITVFPINEKEKQIDNFEPEIKFTMDVEPNFDSSKLNYVIFASDQEQFDSWKNSYQIISEYQNLLSLEVVITQFEHSKLLKSSKAKPVLSEKLRLSLEPTISGISTNGVITAVDAANMMNVSDLWAMGYNGTGVVTAVFDNGVDFSHEALFGQNYGAPVLFNVYNDTSYIPCKLHGTPVAGLIASSGAGSYTSTKGTAFGSKLVSMEMGCDAPYLRGDPMAGFNWLAGQNDTIKVVNLSWGQGEEGHPAGTEFEEIITRLNRLGIVVVVSAGNVKNSNFFGDEFTVLDPGSAIGAITVGAVSDSLKPAYFTSSGPNSKYLSKPDIVAPGYSVFSLNNGGGSASWSGTSFSAPLVTGAIATLISGLDDQNIPWNAGTIKAGLMRSATTLPYDELVVGQGFVNLNATWQFLINSQIDERGPMVLEVTPSTGPHNALQTFPTDTIGQVPISLISSHPDLVTIDITGNLSQIISHNTQLTSDYSQVVYLDVNTVGIPAGWYNGLINSSLGNDYVLSEFSIFVSNPVNHKVLIDLRHTKWDVNLGDYMGGYNIGTMIEIGQNRGFWFHEVNNVLTYEMLSTYDTVWLPDPFNFRDKAYNNPDPLITSEIDALVQFVANGGSLFVDFLGLETYDQNVVGTNTTELNSLISQFGIAASNESLILNYSVTNVFNLTSLSTGVSTITHYGNYLITEPKAQIIGKSGNKTTIATFQNELGGKVLVSSTNFWLDNTGISGQGQYYGGDDDGIMANNVWNWFNNNDTIKIISDNSSPNEINIDFKVLTKDQNSNPMLQIMWSELGNNDTQLIPFSILGDFINFKFKFVNPGDYEILIEYGNEYQRLYFTAQTVTTEPPTNSSSSTLTSIPDTSSSTTSTTTTGISEGKESSGFIAVSSTLITMTLMIFAISYRYRKKRG